MTPTLPNAVPTGWLTKREAMAVLERSIKIFERTVKAKGIPVQYIPQPGNRPTPIYQRSDIEAIKRTLTAARNGPNPNPTQRSKPRERLNALAPVPLERRHLITQRQAQALGYPLELLQEMKRRPNPPGVRYGKRGFRFSVPALFLEMRGIGLLQS